MFLRKKPDEKSDEELLKLYQSTQNLEWLSSLYLRYTSMIYGVCLKYLKDRVESQDAVMEIHEKLVGNLLQHQVANFRSWLYVNAKNHCLMALRARKGKTAEEISPFLMENGLPEHPDVENEKELNISRLEKCIEKLMDAQKLCVQLFYLQEKCYRVIADQTGFELNQVKSYIQNGKRNLKICMEENG